MAQDAPQDSAGPSSPPPALPEGWLAQWEGVSRKWYYVQRATGKSQWEIPTEPVILTPSTTPTSTGTGPSRAPHSRPHTNSPRAAGGLSAAGTDRGISSFLGSQGNLQHGGGFMHMATGMLRNQLLHDKPGGGYNAQPNQQPGQGQAYGPSPGHVMMGHMSQYQNGGQQQNPYGYSSTGQTGVYTGNAPQYHPPGQVVGQAPVPQAHTVPPVNGGLPQPGVGFAGNYNVDPSTDPSSQFSPSAVSSQQYAIQPMMTSGLPNQYQTSSAASGGALPSATQPQWQMEQPAIPQSMKPTRSHQGTGGSVGQQSYNQQAYPSQQQQQQLNQSFTGAQFSSSQFPGTQAMNAYGQPFPGQPGDPYGISGQSASQNFQGAQGPGFQNAYAQNSQYPLYQPGQQGPPFPGNASSVSVPATTASSYNPPMGAAGFGGTPPYPSGTQPGSVSNQHSNPSLNGHFGSAAVQQDNNLSSGGVSELPDNQVGPAGPNQYPVNQAQTGPQAVPFQPQLQQQHPQQYAFGSLNELAAGSEQHRPAMADPHFVSGPWSSSSAMGNVTYVHPEQSRYGNYGGNFR